MSSALQPRKAFEEAKARFAELPPEARVGSMVDFFVEVLAEMTPERIRHLRGQVVGRFAKSRESFETCMLMIELIDAHLATREKRQSKRR
jgi:hypothetical protein